MEYQDYYKVLGVSKNATQDGSVLISQTDTGQDSRTYVVHGKAFEPGAKAPVYFGIQDAENALHDDGDILGYIPRAVHVLREDADSLLHAGYFGPQVI